MADPGPGRWTVTPCMSGERFSLDTNILVYSVDSSAGPKHALAQQIVGLGMRLDCLLALQALSEFFVVVTRKKRVPGSEAVAHVRDLLQLFGTVPASSLSLGTALKQATAKPSQFLGRPSGCDRG